MREIQEKIERFIRTNCMAGQPPDNLREDTQLRTSGLLDFPATLGLISYLEQEFRFEFSVQDLALENFDSIGKIAALVDRHRSAGWPKGKERT